MMASVYNLDDMYLDRAKYGKSRLIYDDLDLEVLKIDWTANSSKKPEDQKVHHSLPVRRRVGSKFTITSGLVEGYYKNLVIEGPPATGGQTFILKPGQIVTDYIGWVEYNVTSSTGSTFVFHGSSFCYEGEFTIQAKMHGYLRLENAYSGAFPEGPVNEQILLIRGHAEIHWI